MASKPSHSKEAMVTRFKSAQQRRLRPMDRSMTALTKLLKSPERKPKGKGESIKKSPKTSLIKGQKQTPRSGSIKSGSSNPKLNNKLASIVEYYPNKLKRHVLTKKIVLKPNNNLKIVAKTSRRKFGTPHKGICSPISSPKQSSESSPEMSIDEVIRIFDETQELDDDDLMEILTCPSPVWWEDPPDSTYIEDPIGERTLPEVESKLKENHVQSKPPTIVPKTDLDINLQDKDIKFKSKRSKLEGLLNNLKGKVNINKNNLSNKAVDTSKHKEGPVVSSNEINHPKQNDVERKSDQNSVLRTKENKSKIIKIPRRDKILIAPKNKGIKRNSKRIVKNIFKSNGNIKIKNPGEINKEVQENWNIKKDDSTRTENDGPAKESEIEKKIQNTNDKEQHDIINSQDTKEEIEEVNKNISKDKDDNVLSDNTDVSEISINEQLLCKLENINIPIGDSSVCKDNCLETTKISDDGKNIDKVETCQKVAANETIQKQGNDESGVENSELVINPNSKKFNGDNDSTDSKEPFIEQDTTATSSSTADIEEKTECNNTLINLFDEEPSYDPHEFDLQFENAILGLENTVLRPGKFKKRAKLCTKPATSKDLKIKADIKLELKNKMSPVSNDKTEAVSSTKVVTGKRKNTNATDEGKNTSMKSETPDSNEMKVRKIEDVSQRGRIRRRKAHFDYKNDMIKTLNIKKEIPDDATLKCPKVFIKPTQNKPQKIKKRKKAQISSEDTKNDVVLNTEVKEPSAETTEDIDNVDDISKRGRIRRKKVPFSDDKPYNDFKTLSQTKTKRKYQKHKTIKTKSQIIIPQKKYYNKKKPNSSNEVYLHPNKKSKTEEESDIVDYVLNDLKTKLSLTKDKNSKLNLTNNISTVPENCINNTIKNKDTETIELKGFDIQVDNTTNKASVQNSQTVASNKPETLKFKEPLDTKTQTFLSVFKEYGENRSANVVDSISDSGVTFIDESNVEITKKHKHNRSNSKTYIKRLKSDTNNTEKTQDMKEIDNISNETGLNVPNLGPNYKSVSPKQQKDFSPEKQNEQIVLNTESKKLVTVQSDKELFDHSNDIETITVFKIMPKEIE